MIGLLCCCYVFCSYAWEHRKWNLLFKYTDFPLGGSNIPYSEKNSLQWVDTHTEPIRQVKVVQRVVLEPF